MDAAVAAAKSKKTDHRARAAGDSGDQEHTNGGRSAGAVHQSDRERRDRRSPQRLRVRVAMACGMRSRPPILVDVRVDVRHRAVLMPVRVKVPALPPHEEPHGQPDDDEADDGFSGALRAVRQSAAEEHHRQTEEEERHRMPEPPEEAEHSRATSAAIVVRQNQRRNCGEVIGIGRMPRAEEQRDGEREAETAAAQIRNPTVKTDQGSTCSRPASRHLAVNDTTNCSQSSMPAPVFEDTSKTSMPDHTFRMLAVSAARSHSTTSAMSTFVTSATSAL